MKKQTLIQSALVLTLAAVIARVLGIAQRVPLQQILGDSGMSLFGISYNIYFIFLIIATAGIPTALSKVIAEYAARNTSNTARKVYRAVFAYTAVTGLVSTVILVVIAPFYAGWIHAPEAALAIQSIAPSLLVFPIIAVMRGYLQGYQWMTPTSVSQIWEQIIRVGTAVLLAYIFLNAGYGQSVAAAGASFGSAAGGFAALAVMFFYIRRHRRDMSVEPPRDNADNIAYGAIFRQIFRLAIPISLTAIAIPVVNFIDSTTVIRLLEPYMSNDAAQEQLGLLTARAQSLAGIPPIIAISLSQAVLPMISSAFSLKQSNEVLRITRQSIRLSLLAGLPMAAGLALLAFPVNVLLFGDAKGSWLIVILCLMTVFQILMTTTAGIIQGLGRTNLPMINIFIGVAFKLAGNFLLVRWFGISGVAIATGLAFLVAMLLNFVSLRHLIGFRLRGKDVMPLFLSTFTMSLIAGGVVGAIWTGFAAQTRFGSLLLTIGGVAVGTIVYMLSIAKFNTLHESEIARLPGPIRRVYRLLMPSRMKGNAS
jgi:stage V sporulation protein B